MSGPVGSQQWMYSSGFYPYKIDNSARLVDGDYFTRTPSSNSNAETWTYSAWVKKHTTTKGSFFFSAGVASTREFLIYIDSTTQRLNVYQYNNATPGIDFQVITSMKFRDTSAWYHIVVAVDTTQATASNRVKVYVNGEQQTDFDVTNYPAQGLGTRNGTTEVQDIGKNAYNQGLDSDFYLAEVNYISGSQLAPTSFGETKADTWIPKKYTGSYGSHDFYLDFATRATDPIDASGNGNNWSSVNTASYDWMPDSPTNNFCTLNPLINRWIVNTSTFTEGSLKVFSSGSSAYTFGTMQAKKFYFEMLCTNLSGPINIAVQEEDLQSEAGSYGIYYGSNGASRIGGVDTTIATYGVGDVVAVAYDHDGGEGRIYKNGTLLRTTTGQNFASYMETYLPGGIIGGNSGGIFNFGQDSSFAGQKTAQGYTDSNGIGDFYYAPPAGYLALCTANLPDPVAAIDPALDASPQDHFNPVLYTGNSSTDRDITGVGFQPDWVWIKKRNAAKSHNLFDVLRGAGKMLETNSTIGDFTDTDRLNGFISDGFNVGNDNAVNNSGDTYVAWNWKAGGTGVSNSDGSITSTVSANTDAGFSVVTYTGAGSTSTVGHGLSTAPNLHILKNRSSSASWIVYTTTIDGTLDYLLLDTTAAAGNSGVSAPTSSVFSVGSDSSTGASGNSYVAYCFHSVEGFSKIGTYTGNGSTDGPFINTGFRPAFVIVKKTNSTGLWIMTDNKRQGYNVNDEALFAEDFSATSSGAQNDFTANGFKLRSNSASANADGDTYLYIAFAEMPFKYANAR